MSTLFERHTQKAGKTRHPETEAALPELPHDVTIPSDLAGLTHPEETRHRPAAGVRWIRWLVVAAVVVAGSAVLALTLTDGSETVDDVEVPWTQVTDGPGSNSLTAAGSTPWAGATEGPGSNTLAP